MLISHSRQISSSSILNKSSSRYVASAEESYPFDQHQLTIVEYTILRNSPTSPLLNLNCEIFPSAQKIHL